VNPAHRDHDELLIVRAASNDVSGVDDQVARRQLGTCEDCRALFDDVAAISAATVADVLQVPPRPRSFRIPHEDLERLRTPVWRRWLGQLGAPSFDLVRPLATVVAGLGLAVTVLGGGLGSVALPGPGTTALLASPTDTVGRELAPGAYSSPTAAPGKVDFGSQASPAATQAAAQDGAGKSVATAAPVPEASATGAPAPEAPPTDLRTPAPASGGGPPLSLPSLGLAAFVAGLGALLLNTAARRAAGR
jgi:hypothetical protein